MRETLNDRLEAYLRARPNIWIDGKTLAQSFGGYGWRSRVSDVRRRGLRIDNRVITHRDERTHTSYKSSLYRYVPAEEPVLVRVDDNGQGAFL